MQTPALVVLVTQVLAVAWFCLLGAAGGCAARSAVGPIAAVRVALWLGLAVATVTIVGVGLVLPLHGRAAVGTMLAISLLALAAWLLLRLRRGRLTEEGPAFVRGWWVAVPIAALALLAIVVAHLAFGPVTNYDTGLYHLNAIQYAENYPTIHGLANLHTRLGTNVSSFNLAAFGGNTPFGADAFRLLAGVYLLVLSTDVVLRLLDGRPGAARRPSTYLLLLSLVIAVPALMQLPDYHVTGVSPDTIALVLTLASGAYLLDALMTRERAWIAVALVTSAVAASVRTQLWVMFAVTVVVLVVDALMRRRTVPSTGSRGLLVSGGVIAGLTLIVMMVRDALLSGWLLFPTTYLPIPVDWRVPRDAADSTRAWLLSWARDSSASPEQTIGSWYWLPAWIRESATEWSVGAAIGLLALALVVTLAVRRPADAPEPDEAARSRWTPLLAVAPALVTVVVWFLTAPDPRFAWGVILLVGAVPAVLALRRLAPAGERPGTVLVVLAGLVSLAVLPIAIGQALAIKGAPAGTPVIHTYPFGPFDVVANVSKLPDPPTRGFTLTDGNAVVIPVEGDQCWAAFPACMPGESTTLRFRGADVGDGFTSE